MASHDHECCCLEGITATNKIERVLDVVTTRSDVHARVEQRVDSGQAARRRGRHTTGLKEQVRLWQGKDRHVGFGHNRCHLGLHRWALHAE